MMTKFFKKWDKKKELAFDCVRIYLGVGLFFRGLIFLISPHIIQSYLESFRYEYVFIAIAHYVAFAHLAGGMLMVVGLLTRLSALVQIPALVGAVLFVNLKQGLMTNDSLELSVMVLFVLCLIVLVGPGKFSMDHYLKTHMK